MRLSLLAVVGTAFVTGLLPPAAPAQTPAAPPADQPMPVDPAVTIGRLANGVTYYVRENRRPERRAFLRLVVNAGSVLEDPDQLGLAHFVEHMAFNGTTHFEKQKLVDFIERTGMRFGAHLNAYTGFDETVYMLAVPTDSAALLAQAIQVLEDWAHGITFDTTEIRKERGVVIEEWRGRRGASARIGDRILPVLFRGSRYAERLPIGTKESLETFSLDALRRFYRDWYRPDLMAVVAVGDFDGREVERLIREHFARIPAPAKPRPRPSYGVPARDSAAVAIATDPEATRTNVEVRFLRPASPRGTVGAYRSALVASLYNRMLNLRLEEVARRPGAPFLGAGSSTGHAVRTVAEFSLGAAVADTAVQAGLEAVLTEVQRVERHGFTEGELARAMRELRRGLERAYAEREKTESSQLIARYVNHFLTGAPIPAIAQELEVATRLLDGITLAEVNRAARDWLALKDRVVLATGPERPNLTLPPGDSLLALFDRVRKKDVAPYEESVSDAPLVAAELPEAAIVEETRDSVFGSTTWTLANGVRVILKPTDFKADEVLFTAYSPGGLSLVPDSLFAPSRVATDAVAAGGLGDFSAVELQKKLAGTVARVVPYIETYWEGFSGGASPRDLRALFELIYLHFTQPRADSAAFEAFRTRLRTSLVHRDANPDAAFEDTVRAILAQHHPRSRPFTAATADSVALAPALAIYRDRFADASDFTFVLVGSFALDSVRPLVRRYLGNLPALRRGEEGRDLGITPPDGVVIREVRKGIEPKSETLLVFTGPFDYSPAERFVLSSLTEVLEMRLRDQLREELGGTYGVNVGAGFSRQPRAEYRVTVEFASAPDRVDELVAAVFAQIDSVRRAGASPDELAKIKESALRSRETALKDNRFWLSQLAAADQSGEDPRELLDLASRLAGLTSDAVRRAAERYLDPQRYVRVTLVPDAAASR